MYNKMRNVTSRTQKIMDCVTSEHKKKEEDQNKTKVIK